MTGTDPSRVDDALRPLSDAGLDDRMVWGLVDAAPDGIVLADESGRMLLVNRQIEELFGYDRGDLLGRSVDDLLPDRLRHAHERHRDDYRTEPRTRAMGADLALLGRRRDGSEFPVEISLSPLASESGLRVVAVVRDVTERVAAQARTTAIMKALDATHDAILIIDAATMRFTYANQGATEQVGYTSDELVGMTMEQIAPDYTYEKLRSVIATSPAGDHGSPTFRTVHRHRNGTEIPVEILLQAVPDDDGRTRAYVKIARDLRERLAAEDRLRRIEQDLRVVEDRERIARDLHDIVIQKLFASGMNLQGLRSRVKDPDHAQRIDAVIDDLDGTIRELRSAIFSLQFDVDSEAGVRSQILQIVADERAALGFEPRVQFHGLLDLMPDSVAQQLLPTLREALSNVARHAAATSVGITIAADDELRLVVSDNGIGISDTASGGNGVRNTAARAASLGGRCEVRRGETGGTVFEWTVPLPHSL